MRHIAKIVVGSFVFGLLVGVLSYAFMEAMGEALVDTEGNIRYFTRRGGPMLVPSLVMVAAAWCGMKTLERFSGVGGAVVIFFLSLPAGAASFGLATALASDGSTALNAGAVQQFAGSMAGVFVIATTWLAYREE